MIFFGGCQSGHSMASLAFASRRPHSSRPFMRTAVSAHLAHAREICGEIAKTCKYGMRAKEPMAPDRYLAGAPFDGDVISADPTAVRLLFEAA
jgi:hypothetical protein